MTTVPSDVLRFVEHETDTDTAIVEVVAKGKGVRLGEIRWTPAWKGYAFYPAADAGFAYRALGDITSQVIAMMDDWAKAAGRKPTHGKSSPYRPRQKRCGHINRDMASDRACGRWMGHTGSHRQMGSDDAGEG